MAIVSELHFGPLASHEDHTTALNEAEQKINEIIFVVNEEQGQVPTWDSIEGKPEFFPADPSSQEVQWSNVQGAPEIPSALDAYTRAQSDAKYGKLAADNSWSETNIFEDVASFLGAALPFAVASDGLVENLNAQKLNGLESSAFVQQQGNAELGSLTITEELTVTGLFSIPQGTGVNGFAWEGGSQAPFEGLPGTSVLNVNLDADKLDGQHGAHYLDWANQTGTPTTLAGYGITDAASDSELATHEADTASVHGIADTADLAVKNADNNFSASQSVVTSGINAEIWATRSGGSSARFQSQAAKSVLLTIGSFPFSFGANGTERWQITSSGHFVAVTDAVNDIGASGATRPRDLFLSRDATIGRNIVLPAPTTATGATAGADTLPANPVGFLVVSIAGTSRKIPYYAA